MRVVAIILALAAGASGCPCSSTFAKEECEFCECEWQDQCEVSTVRRNLRFGATDTGCCTYPDCCLDPNNAWCTRRLTAVEMAALTEEEQEHRRLSCP